MNVAAGSAPKKNKKPPLIGGGLFIGIRVSLGLQFYIIFLNVEVHTSIRRKGDSLCIARRVDHGGHDLFSSIHEYLNGISVYDDPERQLSDIRIQLHLSDRQHVVRVSRLRSVECTGAARYVACENGTKRLILCQSHLESAAG